MKKRVFYLETRRFGLWAPCVLAGLLGLVSTSAEAESLVGWHGSQLGGMTYVTDVAINGNQRVFSGYSIHPFTFAIDAKVFDTSGLPGTQPVNETDLGFSTLTSIATSIAADGSSGYYLTAQQSQPNTEIRSFIFHSSALGSPIPVIGPAPGLSPDVALYAINGAGLAAGDEAATIPLVSNALGVASHLPSSTSESLTSVDANGLWFAGQAEPLPGDFVATIRDTTMVHFQETVDSIAWDTEGAFTVGARNGNVVFWKKTSSGYKLTQIKDIFGNPLAGALLTMDHDDLGYAGGYLDDGRAIVVNLHSGAWFDVSSELGLPNGTLRAIVGIDVDNGIVAFAAEDFDQSAWDVIAFAIDNSVPGPGMLLIPALLLAGVCALGREDPHESTSASCTSKHRAA